MSYMDTRQMVQRGLGKRQIGSVPFARRSGTDVSVLPLKNRIGEFLMRSSPIRARRSMPQPLGSTSETTVAVTINASVCADWPARDPIEGISLYESVWNNPLKYVDTDGRIVQYWPSDRNAPPQIPVPLPFPPWQQPGPIPSKTRAYGPSFMIPDWFNHPAEEGKDCCCNPHATLTDFGRSDHTAPFFITMIANIKISGCYKDIAILWTVCWHTDPDYPGVEIEGVIPSCVNSPSCGFFAWGVGYDTTLQLRYLSCENKKWVKHQESLPHGYHRRWWGGWE